MTGHEIRMQAFERAGGALPGLMANVANEAAATQSAQAKEYIRQALAKIQEARFWYEQASLALPTVAIAQSVS